MRSKVTLTRTRAPTNPDERLTYQGRESSPFTIAIALCIAASRRRFQMLNSWSEREDALAARLQFLDNGLAVGLALRHLHDLTDEELRKLLVALTVTTPLVGVLGDQGFDGIP